VPAMACSRPWATIWGGEGSVACLLALSLVC
jgi:hypothetical protein